MDSAEDPRLELPNRDGRPRADLRGIDLSPEALAKRLAQRGRTSAPWWNAESRTASIGSADLEGADLNGAVLRNALLVGANLQRAALDDTDLRDANLIFVDMRSARLTRTKLQSAALTWADLREAQLIGVDFTGADLSYAKLHGLDMSRCHLQGVKLRGAWLDRTRMWRHQLGDKVGEELQADSSEGPPRTRAAYYLDARETYLLLKQNFDDLGDYDAAGWAYRKERRMEKRQSFHQAQAALKARQLGQAARSYRKWLEDQFVELLCDYGESVWRVLGWIAAVLFVIGPTLVFVLGGLHLAGESWDVYYRLPGTWQEGLSAYIQHYLYTMDVLTTADFSGMNPSNDLVRLTSGILAILGIVLVGLLGFVAGNRIRRS